MITININPVIFHIGSLAVHWYGLMYAVGIIVGLLVAWPYAKSKGITNEQLEKGQYPPALLAPDSTSYSNNPWDLT
jgi:prolipoprotein diacylglyceryltransferase